MTIEDLLSKVLKIDKRLLRIDEIKENYIFFYTMSNVGESENYINIYELAYKCIEEVFKIGFLIETGVHPVIKTNKEDRDYFYLIKDFKGSELSISTIDDIFKSEAEAIFKACQWILDNKED